MEWESALESIVWELQEKDGRVRRLRNPWKKTGSNACSAILMTHANGSLLCGRLAPSNGRLPFHPTPPFIIIVSSLEYQFSMIIMHLRSRNHFSNRHIRRMSYDIRVEFVWQMWQEAQSQCDGLRGIQARPRTIIQN